MCCVVLGCRCAHCAQIERREIKKERRALVAAKINSSIEKELVERLKQGTYEGIANFPQNVFHNALDSLEADNEVPQRMHAWSR